MKGLLVFGVGIIDSFRSSLFMAKVPDSNADSEGHGEENSDSDDPARKSEEVSGDKQIDAGCLQDQEDV